MGNDQSRFSGLEVEKKALEVADFWSHYVASISDFEISTISVLIGELFINGDFWKKGTPLEKLSKHLMIYRHPCIVKYISSWQKNSMFYLAVEDVTPLSHLLAGQNTLQICIGLKNVLNALCFLHEKGQVSHNNLCVAAIYVTKDSAWKLGGMEYLCKFTELTAEYLNKAKTHRYSKGIDPNEKSVVETAKEAVDGYAFGALVTEILKSVDDEIPGLTSFREYCRTSLQNVNVAERPKLSELLNHEFFTHDFIYLHSFLTELPLKSDEEKSEFFQNLAPQLRNFPEEVVANQFSNLLLSRLVLLNKTAQEQLIPFILRPKTPENLFQEATFRRVITPKLVNIFKVRDSQIRLLLLSNFKHFADLFPRDELRNEILPELLVGVKDTDDNLVAVTLRVLSELVPILGASIVIGGKRAKLFNDGRPTVSRRLRKRETVTLPERQRPDGEEEIGEESGQVEEELDNWGDWSESEARQGTPPPVLLETVETRALPDIAQLDIKNQMEVREEIDFFQDMEPVIRAPEKFLVSENEGISTKLSMREGEDGGEDGWGQGEWE